MAVLDMAIKCKWEMDGDTTIYMSTDEARKEFLSKVESKQTQITINPIPDMEDDSDSSKVAVRWRNMQKIMKWLNEDVIKAGYAKYGVESGSGYKKESTVSFKSFKTMVYDKRCTSDLFDRGLITCTKTERVNDMENLFHTKMAFDVLGIDNTGASIFNLRYSVSEIKAEFTDYMDMYNNTDTSTGGGASPDTLALIESSKSMYHVRPCMNLPNFQSSIGSNFEIDSKIKIYDLSSDNGMEMLINACCFRIFKSVSPETVILFATHLTKFKPPMILRMILNGELELGPGDEVELQEIHRLYLLYTDSKLMQNVGRCLLEQDSPDSRRLVQMLCSSNPITKNTIAQADQQAIQKTRDIYKKVKEVLALPTSQPILKYAVRQIDVTNNFLGGAFSTTETETIALDSNNKTRTENYTTTNVSSDDIIRKLPLLRRRIVLNNTPTPIQIDVNTKTDGTIERKYLNTSNVTHTNEQLKGINIKSANWTQCGNIYENLKSSYRDIGQGNANLLITMDNVDDAMINKLLTSEYDFNFSYTADKFQVSVDLTTLVKK